MSKELPFPLKYLFLSFVSPAAGTIAFYYSTAYSGILLVIMALLIFLLPAYLGIKLWKQGSTASRLLSSFNIVCVVFMALPYNYKDVLL